MNPNPSDRDAIESLRKLAAMSGLTGKMQDREVRNCRTALRCLGTAWVATICGLIALFAGPWWGALLFLAVLFVAVPAWINTVQLRLKALLAKGSTP